MKDPRLWIGLLALVSFLTGVAASALFERLSGPRAEPGPFAAYAAELQDRFQLDPERGRHLAVVLRDYDQELQRIRDARTAEFYAALESELRPKGLEYNRIIRDLVLPPDRREEFDALALGQGIPTDAR